MENDEKYQIVEKILENFEGKTVEESLFILEACKLGIIQYVKQKSNQEGGKHD